MAKLYFLSTPAVHRRTGTGLFSLLHTNHTHLMQIDYFDVYIYLFKASDSIWNTPANPMAVTIKKHKPQNHMATFFVT